MYISFRAPHISKEAHLKICRLGDGELRYRLELLSLTDLGPEKMSVQQS